MIYSGNPSTFIPSHQREIAPGEQWLVDRAAETFLETGRWPKLTILTRDAARSGVELPEPIYGMAVHDFIWRPDNDGTVVLSVPGIWRSSSGQEFVEQFLRFVLLCRDIYLGPDQPDENGMLKVTSDDLRVKLGFDDRLIARIRTVIPSEYFLTGSGGGSSDTNWYYFINQTVAKFKSVTTVDAYMNVRAGIVAPRFPATPWPPTAPEQHLASIEQPIAFGDALPPAANTDEGALFVIHLAHVWTVGAQIDEGGFGRVYEARNESGTTAVVKLVKKEPGAERELLLADLSGVRNVVPIIENGEYEDSYALVMPKASYSLKQWRSQRGSTPIDADEAVPILLDIVTALTDLDGKVVHRDIKPANVLFLDGAWCLADFGIARYADASTSSHTRKRALSAPYAAPERWRDEHADSACDIYAVGVIAYELLAGRLPFLGPTFEDFKRQHLQDAPAALSVADRLSGLVDECLNKAPQARPSPANLLVRLSTFKDTAPSGGLAELATVHREIVGQRAQAEAQRSAAQSAEEIRADLHKTAEIALTRITEGLITQIEAAAPSVNIIRPVVRAYQPNDAITLQLGSADLTVTQPKEVPKRDLAPFDVVSTALIAVQGPPDRSGYRGRSHSLWFCDAQIN
jgi:serine/threonine-protein kinase